MWVKLLNNMVASVFFLGGLGVEIKNLVKMFQPKALYQAYNLARLQTNILSHKRSLQSPAKHSTLTNNFIAQTRINSLPTFHKNTLYFTTDTIKELMSYPKCRSVIVINNPARPGSNHREVNYIIIIIIIMKTTMKMMMMVMMS